MSTDTRETSSEGEMARKKGAKIRGKVKQPNCVKIECLQLVSSIVALVINIYFSLKVQCH